MIDNSRHVGYHNGLHVPRYVYRTRVCGIAMNNEDIPALIKELRRRLGLTQEQFAQKVGVTYSTVNHWENGKRTPQPYLISRLLELKKESDADTSGAKHPK